MATEIDNRASDADESDDWSPVRRAAPATPPPNPFWLRPVDQLVIGGVLLALGVTLAGYWVARGGLGGRLIEFDHAPPRTARFQIDINHAELAELMTLPEVGEKLAQTILAHRTTHGPFRQPEDLLDVRGIGKKTLDKLRPYLRGFADDE